MPEDPWTTLITIHCANPALQEQWDDLACVLRIIVARCGFDSLRVKKKLEQIVNALDQIRELTVDVNKPLSKRYK